MERKIVCLSAANAESKRNYEKTVLTPLNLSKFKNFLINIDIPINNQVASIWGVRWDKIWEDISVNDIALFYANRRFISYGTIISKTQNKELAEYLWDSDEYKNLLLLSPVIQINSSREKFWKAFNYAPRLYIQGARIPFIKRQEEIVTEYGSLRTFLENVLDIDELILPE